RPKTRRSEIWNRRGPQVRFGDRTTEQPSLRAVSLGGSALWSPRTGRRGDARQANRSHNSEPRQSTENKCPTPIAKPNPFDAVLYSHQVASAFYAHPLGAPHDSPPVH